MQEVFEKIIKKVKENAYMVVQKNNSKELGMTLCGFEQVINEVSAEYDNGWIPCSERLPEESLNSVIGWDAYRERCVFVQYLQGQWKLGDWESVKITHWMNMPEKPKGE